ncbi:YczE/YyaS/YitT family protein [Methanobrevibacter sp.]|uniref:YczE/YyaS/YitT family protein n=1 Tax=Methanobrevibacter sp. TaxID=66852 RepID=UPI00388F5356
MQFSGEELTFKRICQFVVGLFIMSIGVAFSIVSTLGTTPISSLAYALTLITHINIGMTTFIFNAALILIQFLILRSKFEKKRLLQLINCVLFGYFTDLALYLVSFLPFDGSLVMGVLFLALSIVLLALGIFIYMPANIAPLPGEGCVEAIAIVTNLRFSTVKIIFDATVVTIALILCGLWYTNVFGAVYVGTVISAFFIGYTLRQIANLYKHITGHEINVVNQ